MCVAGQLPIMDVIHFSPPCKSNSRMSQCHHRRAEDPRGLSYTPKGEQNLNTNLNLNADANHNPKPDHKHSLGPNAQPRGVNLKPNLNTKPNPNHNPHFASLL